MIYRKFASFLLAGALLTTMGATPAFAATTTPVCAIRACAETANHLHDGITYAAHHVDDGHNYHSNCSVSGCAQTGSHTHSNCSVSGCTQTGSHTHSSGHHNKGGHHGHRGSHHR